MDTFKSISVLTVTIALLSQACCAEGVCEKEIIEIERLFRLSTLGNSSCLDIESCLSDLSFFKEKNITYRLHNTDSTNIDVVDSTILEFSRFIEHTVGRTLIAHEGTPLVDIYLLDERILSQNTLGEGDIFGLDNQKNRLFTEQVYRYGGCSTRVFITEKESTDEIAYATVFLNASLSGSELRTCILEELYNTMGVFFDPPESASLFDSGNYTQLPHGIFFSESSKKVLRLLYNIADGESPSFQAAYNSVCR